jgi:hypothetical protein
VSSQLDRASTRIRLTSSGIVRSNERRPASTWATGTSALAATSAQARVELTSPTTTTVSTGCSTSQDSNRVITRAVCAPCRPEPACSSASGGRIPRSAKKLPDMASS